MCRYGHLDHLYVLLERILSTQKHGQDTEATTEAATAAGDSSTSLVNSQNATGNTPLHVCALYNKEFCLLTLLDNGADPTVRNFANQDPFQVGLIAFVLTFVV